MGRPKSGFVGTTQVPPFSQARRSTQIFQLEFTNGTLTTTDPTCTPNTRLKGTAVTKVCCPSRPLVISLALTATITRPKAHCVWPVFGGVHSTVPPWQGDIVVRFSTASTVNKVGHCVFNDGVVCVRWNSCLSLFGGCSMVVGSSWLFLFKKLTILRYWRIYVGKTWKNILQISFKFLPKIIWNRPWDLRKRPEIFSTKMYRL